MASISREDVEHVAHLARLHLTDDEVDRMQTQLSNILEAIETLQRSTPATSGRPPP